MKQRRYLVLTVCEGNTIDETDKLCRVGQGGCAAVITCLNAEAESAMKGAMREYWPARNQPKGRHLSRQKQRKEQLKNLKYRNLHRKKG